MELPFFIGKLFNLGRHGRTQAPPGERAGKKQKGRPTPSHLSPHARAGEQLHLIGYFKYSL
jgi:hypothetical protein